MISQTEMIHDFMEAYAEPFNPKLFERKTEDIVTELKKVILSCQRDNYFTLKVTNFEIIDDYETMMNLLCKQQGDTLNKRRKKKVNSYEYVDLKDTDCILMKVTYYIQVKDKYEYLTVYILIPIIVNKYYFRIYGNLYSAMYQIVEGSTYNNNTSNSTKQSITQKILFQPVKLFRNDYKLTSVDGEEYKCISYAAYAFTKSINVFKYFFAKYGLLEGLNFVGISQSVMLSKEEPPSNDKRDLIVFNISDFYISTPKMIFENDPVTQSAIKAIIDEAVKYSRPLDQILLTENWLLSLGMEFGNKSPDKGRDILNSVDGLYDLATKEIMHLPYNQKKDMFHVLRWMVREFPSLRVKDNLDVTLKRLRMAEYIASLYAMKLIQGIYRLSDMKAKIKLESIRKVLLIKPTYLIESACKCNLINYRNTTSDLDSITALKFTFKGLSGMGDKNGNKSVADVYKAVNHSQLGIIDLDSSPKSDPGMSGILCPFVDVEEDGFFSNYSEPNIWEEEFNKLMDQYKQTVGMKEVIEFKRDILGEERTEELEFINSCLNTSKQLLEPVRFVDNTTMTYPLYGVEVSNE